MKRKLITTAAAFLGAAVFLASGGAGLGQQDKADKPGAKKKPAATKTARPAKAAPKKEKKSEKKPAASAKGKSQPAQTKTPGMETRPWMGVATKELMPILREHLDIAEGFGVQIIHVVPDSPADKAGLKPADILTQLEDQLLTTPEHLAILVRSKKKGEKIKLTIIRKGKEEAVTITLGENEMPTYTPRGDNRPFDFRFEPGQEGKGPWHFQGKLDPREFNGKNWLDAMPDFNGKGWQDAMRNFKGKDWQDAMRDGKKWQDALRQYQGLFQGWMEKKNQSKRDGDGRDCPLPQCEPQPQSQPQSQPKEQQSSRAKSDSPKGPPALPAPDNGPSVGSKSKDSSKSSDSSSVSVSVHSGKPSAISVRPGFPIEVFGDAGVVKIDNPKGEVTISEKNGKHSIAIKNGDGETVYDGNFDPKKGAAGLPKEARKLLGEMKLTDLQVVTPKIEKTEKKSNRKSKNEVL